MKKAIITILSTGCLITILSAQNVGIGTGTFTRARLEVRGVAGSGSTSGLFGSDRGVSIQRKAAALGFNQYNDDSSNAGGYGRYLGNGYAALFEAFKEGDIYNSGIGLTIFSNGVSGAVVSPAPRLLRMQRSLNNLVIAYEGNTNARLDVGRGNGTDGTARFEGTTNSSLFNHMTDENTYLRGGKSSSRIYINDIDSGKILFGDGNTLVGVNTAYAQPVYPFEVRQTAGGLAMHTSYPADKVWEWRVASGSPAHFYLYYGGSANFYFSYINGSMNSVSDGRLKTNVHDLEPVMEKLMKLNPVTYEMKDENPGHVRSMGFVSQQVNNFFPQLVTKSFGEDRSLMGLQYSGFGVLAIKGVQESEIELEKLQSQGKEAELNMQQIEQKIAALKQYKN